MGRVNTLETGFAYMKGMTALVGSVLTIYIGWGADLKYPGERSMIKKI